MKGFVLYTLGHPDCCHGDAGTESCILLWLPLSVFIETTNVSLVADLEAYSHPGRPPVNHIDKPQQRQNSCLWLFHFCKVNFRRVHWLPTH